MEWISVKDKLPQDCANILYYERQCGVFKGFYSGGWHTDEDNLGVNGGGYITDEVSQELVTHWMPLPEPPKEA